MRKIFMSIISIMCLGLLLTGCQSGSNAIIDNINQKIALTNYNISGDLKDGETSYSFNGVSVDGDKMLSVKNAKDETVEATIYLDNNDIYIKNGKDVFDLESIFGEIEDTDVEYILINGDNPNVNLNNIDFAILNKYFNIALRNTISSNIDNNKKFVRGEKKVYTIQLSDAEAGVFVNNVFDILYNNAGTIYDDIVQSVDEELQNKYKSSKQKNTEKLQTFILNLKEKYKLTDTASFLYQNKLDNGIYQEHIELKDGDTNLILNIKISAGENTITIPNKSVNITNLRPLTEEEQSAQLESFYEAKYPAASKMKKYLGTIGYSDIKYSTSLDGISLYGTRPSKSLDLDYSIVDEIDIVYLESWLSEVRMIGCFSKNDFNMYGMEAIKMYIDEMQEIINDEFILDFEDVDGSYENITEKWEFYATIENVTIKDNGLVMVELIAKQH